MADRVSSTTAEFQKSTKKFLDPLSELLFGLQQLEKASEEEKQRETERLVQEFKDKISFPEAQQLILKLHELPYIREDKQLKRLWPYFVDLNQNTDFFFQESTLSNPELLAPLTKFLRLAEVQLKVQAKVATTAETITPTSPPLVGFGGAMAGPVTVPSAETEARGDRSAEIDIRERARQQESVKKAKEAFLRRFRVVLEEINHDQLSQQNRFTQQDIEYLADTFIEEGGKPGILNIDVILENPVVASRLTGLSEEIGSRIKARFETVRDIVEASPEFTTTIPFPPPAPVIISPPTAKEAEEITKEVLPTGEARAQALIIEHRGRLLDLNQYIPTARKFEQTDLVNLEEAARLSTLFPERDTAYFLEQSGLLGRLDPNNSRARELLQEIFLSVRDAMLTEQKAKGQSTKVLDISDPQLKSSIQESILSIHQQLNDRLTKNQLPDTSPARHLVTALTSKGSDIKEKPSTEKSSLENIRQEFMVNQIEGERPSTIFTRALTVLREAAGIEAAGEKRSKKTFIETFELQVATEETEDVLRAADDLAFIDIMGSPEEVPVFGENGQPVRYAAPPPAGRPQAQQQAQRLKLLGFAAKRLATNPALIGAGLVGGAAGLTIYSFLTNAAVGASTLTGAIGGAILGQALIPIPVLGAGIGAFAGALGGNAVGNALFAKPLALPVGIQAPGAGALVQAGVSGAGPTLGAGASALASSTASTANSVLAGTQSFLNALPAIQSPFSTLASAGAVVIGPAATTVFVAAAIVVPAMFGAFLGPEGLAVAPESKYLEITKTESHPTNALDASGNPTADVPITYTIKLKPKLSEDQKTPYAITIKDVKDVFRLSSKQTGLTPPTSSLQLGPGPLPSEGVEVSYSITAPANFKDTRITNTLTVTFDVTGPQTANNETVVASAKVSFGSPPLDLGCFTFEAAGQVSGNITSKDWTEEEKEIVAEAFSITEAYPHYRELLCSRGGTTVPIKLYRLAGHDFGGWAISANAVGIYDLSFENSLEKKYPRAKQVTEVRYTLVHESGHIILHRSPATAQSYLASGSTNIPTYPYYGCDTCAPDWQESLSETLAVFVLFHQRKFNVGGEWINFDMPTRSPSNYAWARDQVYQGEPP